MIARVFPFYAQVNNASRSTLITPALKGPLLVAHARFLPTVTSIQQCIEFGYSLQEGNQDALEVNVPHLQAKPYERLQTDFVSSGGTLPVTYTGFIPFAVDPYDIFLGMPLFMDRARITIALMNNTGAIRDFAGYIKIWEDVDPAALACYIDP